MATRLNLIVPFSEKDEAKRQGAQWDPALRVWYIPNGVDQEPFRRWQPVASPINIRARSYYVASCAGRCWKCGEQTTHYTVALLGGYDVLEDFQPDDEAGDPEATEWFVCGGSTFISYITHLPKRIEDRVRSFTRAYFLDFSQTTKSTYWMNHCGQCGMKQGDFPLHEEPGGKFFPVDELQASQITLHAVMESFECGGRTAVVSGFDFSQHARRT